MPVGREPHENVATVLVAPSVIVDLELELMSRDLRMGFGTTWRDGDEPLPWAAHATLWHLLDSHADQVRFHRRLEGVRRLPVPDEAQG